MRVSGRGRGLGVVVGPGVKFWLAVLTELKNRGVADTMVVVVTIL